MGRVSKRDRNRNGNQASNNNSRTPHRVPKGAVGFGDETSRRGRTTTMNAFASFTTTPVPGGADVTVEARRGYLVMPEADVLGDEVVIHLRKDMGPRVGERVKVGRRLVKVKDRRIDSGGRLMLLDEDDGAWYAWEAR